MKSWGVNYFRLFKSIYFGLRNYLEKHIVILHLHEDSLYKKSIMLFFTDR